MEQVALVVVEEELVTVLLEEIEMERMEDQEGVHLFGMVILDLELLAKVMLEHKKLLEETEVVEVEVLVALVD